MAELTAEQVREWLGLWSDFQGGVPLTLDFGTIAKPGHYTLDMLRSSLRSWLTQQAEIERLNSLTYCEIGLLWRDVAMARLKEIEWLRADLEHLQLDYKAMSDTNDLIDA